jgi:hypothetical protein
MGQSLNSAFNYAVQSFALLTQCGILKMWHISRPAGIEKGVVRCSQKIQQKPGLSATKFLTKTIPLSPGTGIIASMQLFPR